MTDKLFTVAGVSTGDGKTKLRFATDYVSRLKRLVRCGQTNIDLVELPRPMTKVEAAEYLLNMDFANGDADVAEAIQHVLGRSGRRAQPEAVVQEVEDDKSPITDRMEPALM